MSNPSKALFNRRSFLSSAATVAIGSAAAGSVAVSAHAGTPIVGSQTAQVYRRKLGSYEITVLGDG